MLLFDIGCLLKVSPRDALIWWLHLGMVSYLDALCRATSLTVKMAIGKVLSQWICHPSESHYVDWLLTLLLLEILLVMDTPARWLLAGGDYCSQWSCHPSESHYMDCFLTVPLLLLEILLVMNTPARWLLPGGNCCSQWSCHPSESHYMDWLLTVPLLLLEILLVMDLTPDQHCSKAWLMGDVAALMIVSGYYGELVVTGDLSRHHSLDFMGCLHGFLPVHCAGVDGRLD